jgi:8-oxo-dGTP diphosphatase
MKSEDSRPDRRRIVLEDGKSFNVRHLGNQVEVPFEKVTSVSVVPFTSAGSVVVTEQDRGLDLPGGHVKVGERSASETARRETREEAQLELGRLVLVDIMESDYLGDSPEDLTYMMVYTARVIAMEPWVPTSEASGREVLAPEEFARRYTAGNSAEMSRVVAAAYAALVDSELDRGQAGHCPPGKPRR